MGRFNGRMHHSQRVVVRYSLTDGDVWGPGGCICTVYRYADMGRCFVMGTDSAYPKHG